MPLRKETIGRSSSRFSAVRRGFFNPIEDPDYFVTAGLIILVGNRDTAGGWLRSNVVARAWGADARTERVAVGFDDAVEARGVALLFRRRIGRSA